MSNVRVQLLNLVGMEEIIERLQGAPEDPQGNQDLLATALLVCHISGWEYESLQEVVEQTWPKVVWVAGIIEAEEEE